MPKTVPINKGNYSLEPPEREERFNRNRASGVEQEYYENRKQWSEYAGTLYVGDYPLLVDAELASACNLKCPFCFRSHEAYKDMDSSLMTLDLFKKIVDEIAGKVFALRLSSRGEPTLNPHFIEAVRYAKSKGMQEVSSLTNGSRLTPEFFTQCMDAGLDWLTVSFDGLDEVYEKYRHPLKFKDTYEKLKQAMAIRRKAGKVKPVIKIQSIWPAIQNNPSKFYNTMSKVCDFIAFNPMVDFSHSKPLEQYRYIEDFACPQLYQRVIVYAGGTVVMCTNDEMGSYPIGDARKQTIHEIWHGDKLNKIRKLHKKKSGFQEFKLCRTCYFPRETEDTLIMVNERPVIVKNYED